jgi:hypothetical protein
MDLIETKWEDVNLLQVALDREQWQALVSTVMKLLVL